MIAPSLRPLGRREVLRLLSGTGLALLAGRPASAQTTSAIVGASNPLEPGSSSFSVLTPELTEGPFYIDLEPDATGHHGRAARRPVAPSHPLT
jgi:hypothetical protein